MLYNDNGIPHSVLSLLVSNRFGVLTKVSTMFSRRGCNIHSLTVGPTQLPEYSRITVTVSEPGDKLDQIFSQLHKLEDVKEVTLVTGKDHLERAFALIKMKKTDLSSLDLMWADQLYISTTDMESGNMAVEALGPTSKVDEFIESLMPYGVELLTRSGCTAI